jgi:hypothetical protein
MGSRNYVINVEDQSVTDRGKIKLEALAGGIERCATKKIGEVYTDIPALQAIPEVNKKDRVDLIMSLLKTGFWPKSLTVRELTPALNGDLVAVTALDSWLTAALAVVGTFYTCFQAVVAPQLPADKLVVFYGASVDSAAVPEPISRMVIRKGGAAGNIIGQYDLEQQMVRQNIDFFFAEPLVIDPQQAFAIQVRCRNATGNAEIVHLHNFLFETAGLIVN